jgi:hypothetical protein
MLGESPFNSPRLLIADARDDIHALNAIVGEFVKNENHTEVTEYDPAQPYFTHAIQFQGRLPERTGLLARRAITSLRSALDQSVYASAVLLNSPNLNATKFPFADTDTELDGDIKRRCRGVAPEIAALIRSLKPYKGGDVTLWALNKLRNIKEHRMLIPSAFGGGLQFPTHTMSRRVIANVQAAFDDTHWDPVNNKLTFTLPRIFPMPVDGQIKTAFFITFGDIEGVRSRPAVTFLYDAARKVVGCIDAIEAETRRLIRERS